MKRKLRIAQVAPLWFTIPPKGYGGIERVIAMLCNTLVDKGHDVTLFASPGSETKAKLVSVYDAPLIAAGIPWSSPVWNLRNIQKAMEAADRGEFDVVHLHLDLWGLFFQGLTATPMVHTLHNPLYRTNADAHKNERLRLFREEESRTDLCFISESARKQAMVEFSRGRVVYNGIDLGHFRYNGGGGDHFIWIARLNKHKGIENAIAAAEKAGAELRLAGRLDPTQEEYFKAAIEPHLNDKIRYVGELKDHQLPDFYGTARALLYPIEWEEPFGLVVAEAMACGTPVIAYRRGSMPELIKDGVSGYVIDSDIDKLVQAMHDVRGLDRAKVRMHVEENFSQERTAEEYEKAYYEILEREGKL